MNEYTIHIELEQNFFDVELESYEDFYLDIEEESLQELQFDN